MHVHSWVETGFLSEFFRYFAAFMHGGDGMLSDYYNLGIGWNCKVPGRGTLRGTTKNSRQDPVSRWKLNQRAPKCKSEVR